MGCFPRFGSRIVDRGLFLVLFSTGSLFVEQTEIIEKGVESERVSQSVASSQSKQQNSSMCY